jgi:hypothetical protein
MALSDVHLSDQHDTIRWKWTSDGQYMVASAYECQFEGSIVHFPAMSIWEARAEAKCNFFAWVVMHDRVLTTNNMMKRNWPCQYNCGFCLCLYETTVHLLTECNFTEVVWNLTAPSFSLLGYNQMSGGPLQWVKCMLQSGSKKEKRRKLGVMFTIWWMIRKERNNSLSRKGNNSFQIRFSDQGGN